MKRLRENAFRQAHQLRGFPNVRIDLSVPVKNDRLLLNCRVLDPHSKIQSIGLQFPGKVVQWLDTQIVHYRTSPTSLSKTVLQPNQPDRFCGLIACQQSPLRAKALILKLTNGRQRRVALKVEPRGLQPLQLIASLLELIPRDANEKRRAFDKALGSIIGDLWESRDPVTSANSVVEYNQVNLKSSLPAISLVIPIYGRYDFIEYQLALFANDTFMYEQEIIYVIDDPRISEEVRNSCDTLARIYPLPFKLLMLQKNLGYAGANNAGVACATGKNVLLLNSDVFPQDSGWLKKLLDAANNDLSNTLLGARLKYHDESIQHDGMSFFSSPFAGGLWINIHPGKGLPSDQFERNVKPQPRESITGACLLMSKENYQLLGGFDESYILGDFEDSDLCMKARAEGLAIALAEDVSLYHLERQSQSLVSGSRWKNELTYYNCWYHTAKWHEQIIRLKKDTLREHRH